MITVKISSLGKSSLADVSEFVLFIWNIKVLQDFINLIEKSSEQLKENPNLGIPFTKKFAKLYFIKTPQCIMNTMTVIK